jgi:hypothetical protein
VDRLELAKLRGGAEMVYIVDILSSNLCFKVEIL